MAITNPKVPRTLPLRSSFLRRNGNLHASFVEIRAPAHARGKFLGLRHDSASAEKLGMPRDYIPNSSGHKGSCPWHPRRGERRAAHFLLDSFRMLASAALASIIYQASPRDSLVLTGAVVAMLLLRLLATGIPAQRALPIDPLILLREE